MTTPADSLKVQVDTFGQEMTSLLIGALPNMPDPVVEIVSHGPRYAIRAGTDGAGVPLFVGGVELATLKARVLCRLDFAKMYLAVESSTFELLAKLDRTPIIRFDYVRDMNTAPNAHIQLHAHRGALSHLLSRANHLTPHDMSSLHIPVGGSRFRPCLEDLIQFVIQECGFDFNVGWEGLVEDGRERWRRLQVAATVRAIPDAAAKTLTDLGYQIQPPTTPANVSMKALRHW